MKRGGLAVVALCWLLARLACAQCPGMSVSQVPFAPEVLTIGGTAVSLTPAIYQPAGTTPSMATATLEGGDIRHLEVGVPTATYGHVIHGVPSATFSICGLDSIKAFKAIRVSTDATLTVTYYKARTP